MGDLRSLFHYTGVMLLKVNLFSWYIKIRLTVLIQKKGRNANECNKQTFKKIQKELDRANGILYTVKAASEWQKRDGMGA